MNLVIEPLDPSRPSSGILIRDHDSVAPPLLTIPEMHQVRQLNDLLKGYIGWADVAIPVIDMNEDQRPESYGGSK